MGFARGGLLVVVCAILFITVLLGSVFLTLSYSLEYEKVQEQIVPIVKNLSESKFNFLEESFDLIPEMERAKDFMLEHCKNNALEDAILNASYAFFAGGYTFSLPCEILDNLEGNANALIDEGINNIVYSIYYDEYDCGFWDCLKKTKYPFFLISEKAKNYWQEQFYHAIIVFLVLVVLIFFLVEQKQNMMIIVGSIMVASSFILLKLEGFLASSIKYPYALFINLFFNSAYPVFWRIFVLGLIIFGVGVALRILGRNFIKNKFSKKELEGIVKNELNKRKEEKSLVEEKKKEEKTSDKAKAPKNTKKSKTKKK